jgi:hypothetical protein
MVLRPYLAKRVMQLERRLRRAASEPLTAEEWAALEELMAAVHELAPATDSVGRLGHGGERATQADRIQPETDSPGGD